MTTTAIVEVQNGGELQGAEKTFEMYVEEWLASLAKEGKRKKVASARTLSTYRYNMKVFKEWVDAEGIDLAAADEDVILSYKAAMNAKNFSASTKNLYLSSVRGFYKWLEDKYGVKNITRGFQGWEVSHEHKRGTLNLQEMKKLLATVTETIRAAEENKDLTAVKRKIAVLKAKRDKAILAALMAGGLRTVEISRLRVGDLTIDAGVAYLFVLGKGKTEKVSVKISRQAYDVIREWQDAREEFGVDVVKDDSPLFCSLATNSFGEDLTTFSISRLVKNYLRAAELKEKTSEKLTADGKQKIVKPIVAHSLRASMATQSYLNGARLDAIKQQLRHSNVETTMIYVREAEKALNPCTDIISAAIF